MTDTDSKQLAGLALELAISSGWAEEYKKERTRLYVTAQKQPRDFEIDIERQLANWILKRRFDETTGQHTKVILRKLDAQTEREQAAKVPDLESQVRKVGELYDRVQSDLTSERRATSEYVVYNLKSLNDFYRAYQEFRPGEHKAFQERLDLHLGSDPIVLNMKELFSIPAGEDYDIEGSIIDNVCISVHKIIPFLQDENARASKAVATASRKAAQMLTFDQQKKTLGGILERQRDRLAKVRTAVEPFMKLYAGKFKSPDDDERVYECLDFVVDDLKQKADEISDLVKKREVAEKELSDALAKPGEDPALVKKLEEREKTLSGVLEHWGKVKGRLVHLQPLYAGQFKSKGDDEQVLECLALILDDLRDRGDKLRGAERESMQQDQIRKNLQGAFDKYKLESEEKLQGAYKTAEDLRKEMDRLDGEKGAAEKRLELYGKNFGTRVDEEVVKRVGDIDQRVEILELAMAKQAEEYESEHPTVAIGLYTQIITNTTDQKRKAECLYLRGRVRRKYAGQPEKGLADMQEAYKLNNDEEIKKVLDTLTTA